MGRVVVGISGASGVVLAHKLIQLLLTLGEEVDLVISTSALYTAREEMGEEYGTPKRFADSFSKEVRLHAINDVGSAIASGSYLTDAMVIVPCSMTTLAALAVGLGDNALRRAADVTLKERRPLILVPRETPLSIIHLENLLKLSQRGATILPPLPAWYTKPKTVDDIEDFIVGKILDALKIKHEVYPRWKSPVYQ